MHFIIVITVLVVAVVPFYVHHMKQIYYETENLYKMNNTVCLTNILSHLFIS